MSPLDEIPAPWRDAMEAAGTYSLRDLATRAGVGTSTVSDLIYGRKLTSERTLQVVADTLRLPVTTMREWAAAARGIEQPFVLPPEANRLSKRERDAVLAVVRAMLDPGDEQGDTAGLVVHATGSGKSETMAAAAQRLADEDGGVVVVADRGPITGPEPAMQHDYGLAARRGPSVGQQQREEQDAAGEAPDPDPAFD